MLWVHKKEKKNPWGPTLENQLLKTHGLGQAWGAWSLSDLPSPPLKAFKLCSAGLGDHSQGDWEQS